MHREDWIAPSVHRWIAEEFGRLDRWWWHPLSPAPMTPWERASRAPRRKKERAINAAIIYIYIYILLYVHVISLYIYTCDVYVYNTIHVYIYCIYILYYIHMWFIVSIYCDKHTPLRTGYLVRYVNKTWHMEVSILNCSSMTTGWFVVSPILGNLHILNMKHVLRH